MSVFDSVRLNAPFRYRTEAQAALRKRQQPARVNHCSPWKIRNLRKKIEILLTLRDSVSNAENADIAAIPPAAPASMPLFVLSMPIISENTESKSVDSILYL